VAIPEEPPAEAALGAAMLFCESCGRETTHRIVRLDRSARAGATTLRGTARCRECRWTHAFVSARPVTTSVEAIVSSGAESARRTVDLPPYLVVRVGEALPALADSAEVRRIDLASGATAEEALAREIRTVWLAERGPPTVRVALMTGARSTTLRVVVDPRTRLEVGGELRTATETVAIVGLRARGQTWRRFGDAFPAGEVTVVYARRTLRPPAGRSPWRREREIPSSRASSTSRSPRSRSSPGRRTNRAVPRARTASGGATARYSASS